MGFTRMGCSWVNKGSLLPEEYPIIQWETSFICNENVKVCEKLFALGSWAKSIFVFKQVIVLI